MNGWFFSRIDYQDKDQRMKDNSLEMISNPYQASGIPTKIFTHMEYMHYYPVPGFNWEYSWGDAPIQDDPRLEGYNVDQRATEFVNFFKQMAQHYRSNNLMHTMVLIQSENFRAPTSASARATFG